MGLANIITKVMMDQADAAVTSGRLSKDAYNTFKQDYEMKVPYDTSMQKIQANNVRKKGLAAQGAKKFDELGARMDEQESGSTFMANLISPAFRANSSEINIDMRKESVKNLVKSSTVELDQALSTRLTKFLGYDKEAQRKFVRAVLDPTAQVDPEYKNMSNGWEKANQLLLKMHTEAGGQIGEIQGIGFIPQTHDTMRMMSLKTGGSKAKNKGSRLIEDAIVAKDKWINFTKKQINYEKMDLIGKSTKEIKEILSDIYETITSGGLNKVKKALAERKNILEVYEKMLKDGRTDAAAKYKEQFSIKDGEAAADLYSDFKIDPMTANQRAKHREIHYTVDGWKAYQKRYGQEDIYKTITDYIEGMSMDIASMQVLGPNPTRVWEKLKSKAAIEGKETGSKGHLQGMFDVSTGKTDASAATTAFEEKLEGFAGGFRSLGVASDLGGAVISSLTDPLTSAITAGHMKASPLGTFMTQIGLVGKMITSGMKVSEKQLFAQRIGLVQDAFMSSIRNNRFSETGGNKTLQKTAEFVLRASGLTAWTNALRTGFSLEMSGFLADNIGKKLSSFEFGKQLQEVYGLVESDWAKLKKSDMTSFEEGGFLDTTKLYQREPELALKLMDIINQETHYAVIMPDSRVRSITTGGGKAKGTVKGELARTALMYKSFPIAMMSVHVGRILGIESAKGKLAYGGAMVIGGSLVGTGVIELKEMMKGREPIKPDDAGSWAKLFGKGLMQSGGLGIIGDLIFSDATRYGGGTVSSVVGKLGQPLEDFDTIKKLIQKDDTKFTDVLSDMARMGSNYVPGRNLWYTRLLYERALKDQLMKAIDPDYNKKLSRHMRKLKKETGQGYWAKPGELPF